MKKKWTKAKIKVEIVQYWRTSRDDDVRRKNGKFEQHRLNARRSLRMKRKLIYKQGAIETSDLSQQDKDRIKELLSRENALKYISSEESEEENATPGNGPTPRHVRPLKWERSKLRTIKSVLNATHQARMSKRQKRTAVR